MHSLRALGGLPVSTLSQHAHNASHAPPAAGCWYVLSSTVGVLKEVGRPSTSTASLLVAWLQRYASGIVRLGARCWHQSEPGGSHQTHQLRA
jgi:hypothetical protein